MAERSGSPPSPSGGRRRTPSPGPAPGAARRARSRRRGCAPAARRRRPPSSRSAGPRARSSDRQYGRRGARAASAEPSSSRRDGAHAAAARLHAPPLGGAHVQDRVGRGAELARVRDDGLERAAERLQRARRSRRGRRRPPASRTGPRAARPRGRRAAGAPWRPRGRATRRRSPHRDSRARGRGVRSRARARRPSASVSTRRPRAAPRSSGLSPLRRASSYATASIAPVQSTRVPRQANATTSISSSMRGDRTLSDNLTQGLSDSLTVLPADTRPTHSAWPGLVAFGFGRCGGGSTRGRGTCTPRTDRSGPTPPGSSGRWCRRRRARRPCSAGGPRRPEPRCVCLVEGRRPARR